MKNIFKGDKEEICLRIFCMSILLLTLAIFIYDCYLYKNNSLGITWLLLSIFNVVFAIINLIRALPIGED